MPYVHLLTYQIISYKAGTSGCMCNPEPERISSPTACSIRYPHRCAISRIEASMSATSLHSIGFSLTIHGRSATPEGLWLRSKGSRCPLTYSDPFAEEQSWRNRRVHPVLLYARLVYHVLRRMHVSRPLIWCSTARLQHGKRPRLRPSWITSILYPAIRCRVCKGLTCILHSFLHSQSLSKSRTDPAVDLVAP